jgi:Tfp pilus assembly protein PilF
LKHSKKAITDFTQAIKLYDVMDYYYFYRANAYLITHKHKQALFDLNKAIELNGQYKIYYQTRAFIYTQIGEN